MTPPPPDKQQEQHAQSDCSPSLLLPSFSSHGGEPTDFITATVAHGYCTTPTHQAVLHLTSPSLMTTKNSFAVLAPPDSSPASPDLPTERAAVDPRLASFYNTWPESEGDDSNRQTWDSLHLGFTQASMFYDSLEELQAPILRSFTALQSSHQKGMKTNF